MAFPGTWRMSTAGKRLTGNLPEAVMWLHTMLPCQGAHCLS